MASPWTAQTDAALAELWGTKSAAEIAAALGPGITRNAVIGRAHRLQLQRGGRPAAKPTAPAKAPAKAAVGAILAKRPEPAALGALFEGSPVAIALHGIVAGRTCRYPIGDPVLAPEAFRFCDAPVRAQDASYCAAHHKNCIDRIVVPSGPRRGTAAPHVGR